MHFLFLYKKVGLVAILMAKELDIALVKIFIIVEMALEVQQFQFSYFRRIKNVHLTVCICNGIPMVGINVGWVSQKWVRICHSLGYI
jgi:hypothetical protein